MSVETGAAPVLSLQRDAWLTEKFGYAVWRVAHGADGEPLSALRSPDPLFAYAKVDTADVATLWSLSESGFRVIDAALTLEVSGRVDAPGNDARLARPGDRKAVERIAGSSFRYTRFHLDPLISLDMAHAIKAGWAGNFFEGARGDGMVVAERDGRVVGFTQVLWQSADCLVIDLIGVETAYQGRGIGRAMIGYAWQHGTGESRRPSRIRVGTQVANTPSIRLYESLGFRVTSSQYVLHFHGGPLLAGDAHRRD